MTAKETRDFEEGKAYGYRHPGKTHGWFKSVAWNMGLAVGKKRRHEEMVEEHKRGMARAKRLRKLQEFRESQRCPTGPSSETGLGGR